MILILKVIYYEMSSSFLWSFKGIESVPPKIKELDKKKQESYQELHENHFKAYLIFKAFRYLFWVIVIMYITFFEK